MKKKGSLSLSINAIVVLIIAITILGLILGFVTKMFGSLETRLVGLASEEPAAPVANAGNPFTLSRNNIVLSKGDEVALRASVFNVGDASISSFAVGSCGAISIPAGEYTTPPITKSTAEEVLFIVQATTKKTTICKFTATFGTGNTAYTETISVPVKVI